MITELPVFTKSLRGLQMRNWHAVMLAALIAGCSASFPESPSPTPTLAGIRVHYLNPHTWINSGATISLALYAVNTEGVYQAVTPSAASWFSSNTAIATVTNGAVRGVSGGDVDILATYQGHTSSARVVILEPFRPYPWLDIRSLATVETGAARRASALLFDTASTSRDVTDQATWSSSDTRVFTVAAGQVTAAGPGTAFVTATFDGITARVFASVPPLRKLP
jgi:hypothetical protein